jgi:hypothetical protein
MVGAMMLLGTGSRASSQAPEYIVEFRLTQQGRKMHVEVWTQPGLGQEGVIYFETAEDPSPLERLQLHTKQAQIQETVPTRFVSTPFSYYARYKREKHQRLDRVMLVVSGLIFPVRLAEDMPDGVYKLVVAVSVDQDKDGSFSEAKLIKASKKLQYCSDYDNNPMAYPLQAAFFKVPRGDNSMDWNCNGKINLSQVTFGMPGAYELRGTKCVEIIPPVLGWATFIPTEVGLIAHCYSNLTDNSSEAFPAIFSGIGPVCRQPISLCVQHGN